MSAGIKKPNSIELLEDLKAIIQINERICSLDVVRLKELLIFVKKTKIERFKFINEFLILNPTYTFDYAINYITQYGLSFIDLEYLKDLIQTRIEYLTKEQTNSFNDLVFKDVQSERFFTYLVENWLKEEVNKRTALSYIFIQMWYKTKESVTTYKIKSSQTYFALDYWNVHYKHLLDLPKKPRFNKGDFIDYYRERFKKHLNEFKEV